MYSLVVNFVLAYINFTARQVIRDLLLRYSRPFFPIKNKAASNFHFETARSEETTVDEKCPFFAKLKVRYASCTKKQRKDKQVSINDINSLSHTKWNCKYHIVFAPKYRRQVFYGEKRVAIGKILRQLCEWKGVNIVEAEMCPDHVHMLVEIPPKIAVSSFMGYLKGKSSTMLYEQFGELKYKYRNREFWCRGYYVDTVGKNTSRIAEYIRKQLEEDKLGEQLTLPINGPFTGGK